ncbi:dipeptidase [Granulicella mallensis]|uniref:Membrane dipeptidase n=1 Tax=Granulicella mallensis TaxID=940614 RepID=A0A7W7ZM76_9BACT|nr:dipeptidase [Granulicella mallensis]MBB5062500.1 membrane dipeptidase [Granulicella mallensis]
MSLKAATNFSTEANVHTGHRNRSQSNDLAVRARKLADEAIGIDSHIDTVQRILVMGEDLGKRWDVGHVDIPRLHAGGTHAPFFALWVPVYFPGAEAVRRTLDLRDAMQTLFETRKDEIELATTADDIERIVKEGKIAAFITVEGGHTIDDDLRVLRMYYQLGIRSMTLTHSRNNNWADSATDTPVHNGLTDFGREVVREMNRLGMVVDVSHVADKTFYDALEVTTKPVMLTHSSMRAISDVPRNVTDEMLWALAKNGGVVGITFGEGFINPKDAEALRSAIEIETTAPVMAGRTLDDYAAQDVRKLFGTRVKVAATVEDVADHIDHAVKVAGIDHVGIGSDFDGVSGPPNGLDDVSKMPALIEVLLERGYSDRDLKKILGGNTLRVIREVTGR